MERLKPRMISLELMLFLMAYCAMDVGIVLKEKNKSHDKDLIKLLQRARERNLKFNKKLRIRQRE